MQCLSVFNSVTVVAANTGFTYDKQHYNLFKTHFNQHAFLGHIHFCRGYFIPTTEMDESVLLFPMWYHGFKDCVKMIKASDFEPPCSKGSERTKPVIPVERSLPV